MNSSRRTLATLWVMRLLDTHGILCYHIIEINRVIGFLPPSEKLPEWQPARTTFGLVGRVFVCLEFPYKDLTTHQVKVGAIPSCEFPVDGPTNHINHLKQVVTLGAPEG